MPAQDHFMGAVPHVRSRLVRANSRRWSPRDLAGSGRKAATAERLGEAQEVSIRIVREHFSLPLFDGLIDLIPSVLRRPEQRVALLTE